VDSEEEVIETLKGLGLTVLQARVYLALAKSGKATIKVIATTAKVDRADVYRIVAKLQKLGLAEKVIAAPTTHRATPIRDGFSILLQQKTQEYTDLQKKTEELLSNFQNNNLETPIQVEDSQFIIIYEKKLLYKTLDERNRVVQKKLDVSGPWVGTRSALFDFELEVFKSALERGVRIRWITETHEEDKATLKILRTLQKNPLFKIRYFAPPIPLQTAIYDEKEVIVCIASLPSNEVNSILSNNPVLVKLVANYYEEIWNSALKDYSMNKVKALKQKTVTLTH
jgi:sugar-specific transcriptional regulator TrmB